jgi:hypothetical protein
MWLDQHHSPAYVFYLAALFAQLSKTPAVAEVFWMTMTISSPPWMKLHKHHLLRVYVTFHHFNYLL